MFDSNWCMSMYRYSVYILHLVEPHLGSLWQCQHQVEHKLFSLWEICTASLLSEWSDQRSRLGGIFAGKITSLLPTKWCKCRQPLIAHRMGGPGCLISFVLCTQ